VEQYDILELGAREFVPVPVMSTGSLQSHQVSYYVNMARMALAARKR
jgi:hypothetical protein